jgi:hypothetical protein
MLPRSVYASPKPDARPLGKKPRRAARSRVTRSRHKRPTPPSTAMVAWLRDHGVVHSRDPEHLAAALKVYSRSSLIEPPTPDRIDRIVHAATHAYEECFCQRLSLGVDCEPAVID